MQIDGHDIAVCSWSLRPKDSADLASLVGPLGISHVQLALGPLVLLDDKRKHHELGQLRAASLALVSGMISFPGEDYASIDAIRATGGFVPDAHWPVRRGLTKAAGNLAAELGLKQVSTHVGFVPPAGDARYAAVVERIGGVADEFKSAGLELLMETGQEPAEELKHFLEDLKRANVGVNFDPANMILYGAGDPIEAIRVLGRHIRQVHVKDAVASPRPGVEWGEEVPFGRGRVDVAAFLKALKDVGYAGPLVIEREAGESRSADVVEAVRALQTAAAGRYVPPPKGG